MAVVILASGALQASAADFSELEHQLAAGEYETVLDGLQELSEPAQQSDHARFLRATALARLGKRKQAIDDFKALVAKHPKVPELYNNLAALYAADGQLAKAKEVLERAMRTDPRYATVYENLSAIYVEMARESYVKALRMEKSGHHPQLTMLYRFDGGAAPAAEPVRVAQADRAPTPPKPPAVPAPAPKPSPAPTPEPVPATPVPKPVPKPVTTAPSERPSPPVAPAAAVRPEAPADAPAPATIPAQTEAAQTEAASAEQPAAAGEATAPAPAADPGAAVMASLKAWAVAWAAQDIEGYLGHYAPDFRPSNGMSRQAWEAQRRRRLTRPDHITITLGAARLTPLSADRVRVDLTQNYASPRYSDVTRKRFILRRSEGRWLIQAEKSLKVMH